MYTRCRRLRYKFTITNGETGKKLATKVVVVRGTHGVAAAVFLRPPGATFVNTKCARPRTSPYLELRTTDPTNTRREGVRAEWRRRGVHARAARRRCEAVDRGPSALSEPAMPVIRRPSERPGRVRAAGAANESGRLIKDVGRPPTRPPLETDGPAKPS